MSNPKSRWKDEWDELPEDMRRFATRVGPTHAHVLLLGPTGSGKGYLARILHEMSPRAAGPFVPHNCGVFTEALAEAQLFGSMKGAYTGASGSKPGLVEAAAGGTLFLDEFGALPRVMQAMFLILRGRAGQDVMEEAIEVGNARFPHTSVSRRTVAALLRSTGYDTTPLALVVDSDGRIAGLEHITNDPAVADRLVVMALQAKQWIDGRKPIEDEVRGSLD